jgi:hypothetical protein
MRLCDGQRNLLRDRIERLTVLPGQSQHGRQVARVNAHVSGVSEGFVIGV